MDDYICPACGSDDLSKSTLVKSIQEPFAGKKEVEIVNYTCSTCGFDGDIFKENEKALQECIDELKIRAVKNILEDFQQNNYSFSAIERALEIPQRTLSKWKSANSKPSAAVVALLKYLHLFPWLIEVAEQKYDYPAAQRIHISDALEQFVNRMAFDNESRELKTSTTIRFLQVEISNQSDVFPAENNSFGFTFPELATISTGG
ncbi:MAG: hypothetical protein KKD21_00680 [Proteobacteria bacterium]|nr:hypothetical protein [Pseudomonadota bacterium]MBU1695545.1 hypothetical protein [Pseudomonadota bacterium]